MFSRARGRGLAVSQVTRPRRLHGRVGSMPAAAWAVAALLYLALTLPQLGRPLTYDEVDFAKAAQAVAGGSFVYDRGYIADYPWNVGSGRRFQYALYHPPGYLLALASWQRLAWRSDSALRAFGALCGLATLAGVVALARLAGGSRAAGYAALFWATSPYALQSTLLLDIDGTVLAVAVAAFVWLALRAAGSATRMYPRWALSAMAFALALWLKLTTPILVAAWLALWLALVGRRRAAGQVAAACLAGALLFAVSWWAFGVHLGLPVAQPFQDVWFEALDAAGLAPAASRSAADLGLLGWRVLVGLLRSAQWLHPLLVALLVAAPLALRRTEPAAGLLFVAAATMSMSLIKLAAGFPKYHAGALPLAVAIAGVAAARWIGPLPACGRYLAAGFALGAAGSVATGPDALIRHADLRLLATWLAAAAGCLALAGLAGPRRAGGLAVGLLLGANLALAGQQATSGWSTTYFYGTTGQVEAGAWLQATAQPGELVAADREVAYYAAPVHFLDSERFIALAASSDPPAGSPLPSVRLIVSQHARVADLLPARARPAGAFGAYRAWVVEHD